MAKVARWCILNMGVNPVQIVAQDAKGGWTTNGAGTTTLLLYYPETFVALPAVFCNSTAQSTNLDSSAQWGNINSYSITQCSPRAYGATSTSQTFRYLTVVVFGEVE